MLGFFGLTAKAQTEKTTSDLNKEVIELIKIQSGDVVTSLLKPALERVSGEKRKQMKRDIDAVLDNYYSKTVEIYLNYYSKEEIHQILDFYQSELGQKIKDVQPKITQKTMKMSQGLMRELDPVIRKYLERK